ncbi:hypothetical protein CEXT_668621 [Caerostris extrusa]|uniref:Uncharacterized protein n=1 Tax=Caerostris extrusa TaxID=172846 RepID=A0AAV4TA58_CAEEX|nr:hypothetical protein CEXT_668621 [Caerostris extrusa]
MTNPAQLPKAFWTVLSLFQWRLCEQHFQRLSQASPGFLGSSTNQQEDSIAEATLKPFHQRSWRHSPMAAPSGGSPSQTGGTQGLDFGHKLGAWHSNAPALRKHLFVMIWQGGHEAD